MSEGNTPVRLHYRHVPLAEAPALRTVDDGVFVALAAPPPVRTALRLELADGSVRALVVTRVVEGEGEGARAERGFYARDLERDELAASDRVGSEHLHTPDTGPDLAGTEACGETTGPDDASDSGHLAMAMPAPVVVDEDDDEDEASASDTDLGGTDEDAGPSEREPDGESDEAAGSRKGRARRRRAKKPKK